MIIFYTTIRESNPIISMASKSSICDTICATNCIKTKNKCCNKYKKKGINCKRCPLSLELKAVS